MVPSAALPDVNALLLIAVVGLFGIGLVKGVAGFGSGLLAVPLVSKLFSPTLALGVLSVTLWLANVHLSARSGLPRDVLVSHKGHVAVAVVASVVGVLGVTVLPESLVYLALGGYISLYLLSRNTSVGLGDSVSCSRNDLLAGGVGGFIVGAFLSGGPVFVSYFQSLDITEEDFVAALSFVFALTMMVRIVPMYAAGSFGASELLVGAGFLVPLSVGVATGDRVRPHVPRDAFDRFVELLLVGVAANLLFDGLRSVL